MFFLLHEFSIIEFDNRDDLKYAMKKLDNAEINGKKITISRVSVLYINLYHFIFYNLEIDF